MSTRIMAVCWPLAMPPTAKAVLVSLADQANDQGVCWPSVASVCERTCLAERTVRNAMRWLEQAGLLQVEIGAMRANRYTLTPSLFCPPPGAAPVPDVVTTGAPHAPGTTCPPASGAGQGGTTCPLTVREPNTGIPPNPPLPVAKGGDAPVPLAKARKRQPAESVSLEQWLSSCKAAGRKPIPPGDPVFGYCEQVGIGSEILLLHWHEFKARRRAGRKRQADWPATFRNSVRDNWFRLWFIAPGQPAELTTVGRQAQAARAAAEREALALQARSAA